MAASIPKKIGKYDVLDVIGKGGMGIVYRAKDPFLDRMVAIKIMTISYADYPDLLQRFYREAKATAQLQHPNIVTVYELGEHEGSPYLAMQYLEGSSLETLLRSHADLTLPQKIDIIVQACHGLSYAHQRGIIHRDIKPGNIMVLKDGSVKIVDFGIARIGDTNFTRTGQFMGSLNYMSLEQLNDKLQVDQRTDVYSTGVVLYQVLTGALPFEADSTGATLMKILNEAPPPFSKYLSSFPPEIEAITIKALAKDRDQRYGSADELALDLTQLLDRLKQDLIGTHMQHAETLLQQNDLFKANDALLEVLKLDKQNTRAASMLRTLRKQIEKEQSVERARQLREQAEEALSREEYDPALGYLDQAIHLDATNSELPQLRAKVQAAKAEIEHLRQMMQRAENAHRAGNLDTAKQAIEEVLARRPNDTRVKSLYRMVQKELEERMRQKRLENLLEAARKEMSNRRYTAAFDILKEAEKVDPDAPALRSLLDSFTTAREQEQRRRALEELTRQVEQALNTDDHQSALTALAEGLKRFPGEPALLKLKDLAESQRQAAQTKTFVRERIAAAREILNAGNASGALKVLQDALKKAPGNPHLESLVSIAQERVTQDRDEQAKAQCVQQANAALDRRDYDEAIRLLEAGQVRFTSSPEIDSRLRFAREQQAKEAKQLDVEKSVRRAQELLRTQEYDRAISLLESILSRAPDQELEIVLEEARRRRDALNGQIAAAITRGQQFLQEGSPAKAVEFLQAQPTSFRRSDQFRELLLAAANQNRPPEPDVVSVPEPEWGDAPEPEGTMVWGGAAPPEVEDRPAPRVPTGRISQPTAPPAEPPVAGPGFLQRLTKQQMVLAAGALSLVLFVVLVVLLWPSSKAGSLTVSSNVDGTEIVVDGQSRGTINGGHKALALEQGTHRVAVLKPDYDVSPSGEQAVEVVKGKEVSLSFSLTPIPPATGTLTITTNVDDVDVFIDNDAKRVTNGKRLQLTLPARDHVIRLSKDNYEPLPAKSIHLDKDQTALVAFTLKPFKTPPGFLDVVSTPSTPGAAVAIDDVPWGTLGPDGKAHIPVQPKGNFVVQITSSTTETWKKTVGPVQERQMLSVVANLTLKRVEPKPPAEIAFFQSDRESVPPGGTVRLSWKISHATAAEIDHGIGAVSPGSDSKEVPVSANTTYRLTAKGEDGGTVTKDAPVKVVTPPPPPPPKAPAVTSFTATPPTIKQGDSTTLSWSTTDAQSVVLDGVAGNQPANGSVRVKPNQNTTYKLTATGAGGSTDSSTSVAVENPPPPPPPPPNLKAELIAALGRLSQAYQMQVVGEVKREWTGITPEQEKKLKDLFSSSHLKAISIKYDPCEDPTQSGETATMACSEVLSYTADGSRRSPPAKAMKISFKRTAGVWRVDTIFPAK